MALVIEQVLIPSFRILAFVTQRMALFPIESFLIHLLYLNRSSPNLMTDKERPPGCSFYLQQDRLQDPVVTTRAIVIKTSRITRHDLHVQSFRFCLRSPSQGDDFRAELH